jgi:hypothetical protein
MSSHNLTTPSMRATVSRLRVLGSRCRTLLRQHSALTVLLLLQLSGCVPDCGASTPKAKPIRRVVVVSGGGQNGFSGTALAQPVTVRVDIDYCYLKDDTAVCEGREPAVGEPVAWVVTSGGGTVSVATVSTDNQGFASVNWTLGSGGPNTIEGRTNSLNADQVHFGAETSVATVTATALQHQPILAVVSGAAQVGPVSTVLPLAVVVELTDVKIVGGRGPSVGVPVSWSVAGGGASINPAQSTTDAAGRASATWTLGSTLGAQQLQASIQASSGLAAGSVTQLIIGATAQQAPARLLRIVSGAGQPGIVGRALRDSIVVEYVTINPVTSGITPVVGATVTFAPGGGFGTASPTAVQTDAQGRASTQWTLGSIIGAQSLNVTTPPTSGFDASSVFAFSVGSTAAPTNVVLQDDFESGDRWTYVATRNDFSAWAFTRTIATTGGNPGAYASMFRNTVTTTNPTFASLFTLGLFSGGTYVPSLQGPIVSIDYRVDRITDKGLYDAFVIVQDGVEYRAEFPAGSVFSNTSWASASLLNLVPANFSPSPGPNFSNTGTSMQFGFTRGSSQRFAFYTTADGIDNWSVTIKR